MQITEASANDLDAAYTIVVESRLSLEAQGLMQWDPLYPSQSFFADAAADGSLFVLWVSGRICGVVVLNELQAPEWNVATWQEKRPPFLVIHAFAISPYVQGRGYGRQLLHFCEDFARERSYTSIRLDAFSENSAALRFYEKQSYVFRGEVQFASKPVSHQRYYCYEKSLVQNEQSSQPNISFKADGFADA
jgi:ribosomal protein S18 acetylase RimI-like enzyme